MKLYMVRLTMGAGIATSLLLALGMSPRPAGTWTSYTSTTVEVTVGDFSLLDPIVEIQPDSLTLSDEGEEVTARLQFPVGDALGIDVLSVRLCLGSTSCGAGGVPAVGGSPGGTAQEATMTFGRTELVPILAGLEPPPEGMSVVLAVSGLNGERTFVGSDTILVFAAELAAPTPPGPPGAPGQEEPSPDPSDAPSEDPESGGAAGPTEPTVPPESPALEPAPEEPGSPTPESPPSPSSSPSPNATDLPEPSDPAPDAVDPTPTTPPTSQDGDIAALDPTPPPEPCPTTSPLLSPSSSPASSSSPSPSPEPAQEPEPPGACTTILSPSADAPPSTEVDGAPTPSGTPSPHPGSEPEETESSEESESPAGALPFLLPLGLRPVGRHGRSGRSCG
jgi:hypothetical protein